MLIPELGHGGAETSFIDLAFLLSEHHNITIAAFTDVGFEELTQFELVVIGNGNRSKTIYGKINDFLNRRSEYARLLQRLKADVSISFLEGANYINSLCGKYAKQTILSVRGSKLYDQNIKGVQGYFRKRLLIPKLYKKADVIVTISEGLRQEMIDKFGMQSSKVKCIPNMFDYNNIDVKLNETLPSIYNDIYREKVIISHGRLAVEKNFGNLIEVYSSLNETEKDLRLIILGSGMLLGSLIQKATSNGLSVSNWHSGTNEPADSNVHFIPHQKNVFPFLKMSDLYIMNSTHEGFGKALIEALYSGTKVLAKNVPYGPGEILKTFGLVENLILADSNNRNFASRIKTELSRGKPIQIDRSSFHRFSRDKVMEEWNQVIEDAKDTYH